MNRIFRLTVERRLRSGFTLIEILIAIAITLTIAAGISLSFNQLITVNASSVGRETAIKQVENAVQYISRDAQQAQTVTTSGSNFPLSLTWTSWSNDHYLVSYNLSGNRLMKQLTLNAGQPASTFVADYIDTSAGMTTCSFSSGLLSVKITATVGGLKPASESRSFQIKVRSFH
jgi:prepilin-type N-terminal cleavage/methylation domain-containing protein